MTESPTAQAQTMSFGKQHKETSKSKIMKKLCYMLFNV